MLPRSSFVALFASGVFAGSLTAQAQHLDVQPAQNGQSGKIVTNGHDDVQDVDILNIRAFGYDFGEDSDNPFRITDPGFNSPAGALTASTQLRFRVTSSLIFWNGTGLSPVFAPPPSSEVLTLFSPLVNTSINVGGATGPLAGFRIGTVSGSGSIHQHIVSTLLGGDGNEVPAGPGNWGTGDGVQAAAGIYAFEMELFLSDTSAAEIAGTASDPFWIVYNNGLTETQHDLAIDALAVPEVSSLSALGVGALALLARRRRFI